MQMLKFVWQSNKPLTVTALLMVPVLVFSLAGLYFDPRVIAWVAV